MAAGMDFRKRAGSSSGFLVGRLKTAKKDARTAKERLRERKRRVARGEGGRGVFGRTEHVPGSDDEVGDERGSRGGGSRYRRGGRTEVRAAPSTGRNREWSGAASDGRVRVGISGRRNSLANSAYSDEDQSDGEEENRRRVHFTSSSSYSGLSSGKLKSKVKASSVKDGRRIRQKSLGTNKVKHSPERKSTYSGSSQQVEVDQKSVKKITKKKSSAEEAADSGDRPKRKKRIIRLDPHDISNKRIVDSDSTSTSTSTKEKIEEKDIELSQNAQFRAIQPSPAILSFVEDNLMGRRRNNELRKAGYNINLSAPLDNIPFSTCTDRERIEENVFRNKMDFFAAAKVSSSFPPPVLPEIAFAGRSNVGKSSLLNALTRQWGVVRTSDKPGHTQTINFFRLASKLCLVDLPGYGFAYAKEEVKDAWEELVKEYVSTREGLDRVCLLIDTKWGMKPRDHELIDLMEKFKTPYQIVLTKTDVVFPVDVARRAMQIQESLKARTSVIEPVMMVSSKSGAGIRSLRTVLAKLARFIKP